MRSAASILALLAINCQNQPSAALGAPIAAGVSLTGSGSTFVSPLFSKWFAEYNRLHPEVRTNYQSIGSSGGVAQILVKNVDFGATDSALSDEELAKAHGIVHIPVTLGAVVPVFHLSTIATLRFTPETLASIYLGKVTRWSDPAIAADNPGVSLPAVDIVVAHRDDGSGTTAIFTDYLAKTSSAWRAGPGSGRTVKWPIGVGGTGNEGVAEIVERSEGAIGYVELAFARKYNEIAFSKKFQMSIASLRNRAGEFVAPSIEGISAAAAQATIPDDFRLSLTDAPGAGAWPIAGFTWVLLYSDQPYRPKGEALLKLLWWCIHDGQGLAPSLEYAPLPPSLVTRVETRLKAVTVESRPFSSGGQL